MIHWKWHPKPGFIWNLGMGRFPSHLKNDGNPYFMGTYKPLRNWVDEFIPYYMEIMGVYPLLYGNNGSLSPIIWK